MHSVCLYILRDVIQRYIHVFNTGLLTLSNENNLHQFQRLVKVAR